MMQPSPIIAPWSNQLAHGEKLRGGIRRPFGKGRATSAPAAGVNAAAARTRERPGNVAFMALRLPSPSTQLTGPMFSFAKRPSPLLCTRGKQAGGGVMQHGCSKKRDAKKPQAACESFHEFPGKKQFSAGEDFLPLRVNFFLSIISNLLAPPPQITIVKKSLMSRKNQGQNVQFFLNETNFFPSKIKLSPGKKQKHHKACKICLNRKRKMCQS